MVLLTIKRKRKLTAENIRSDLVSIYECFVAGRQTSKASTVLLCEEFFLDADGYQHSVRVKIISADNPSTDMQKNGVYVWLRMIEFSNSL